MSNTKARVSDEFIKKLQKGDQASFALLYDNYAANLLGVIRTIVPSSDLAEDVLQRSFVKIWKNLERFDGSKGSLFTWMLNISRNLAIDENRKYKRDKAKVIQNENEDVYISINDGEDHSQVKKLKKAIAELPEDQKYVIEQLFFGGLTQKELEEADNIPIGTIKSRVRLAFKKMRNSIQIFLFWI